MSDWELVADNKTPKIYQSSSDWEIVPASQVSQKNHTQESFGSAAAKAPFRVGEDILRGGMNFLKNIHNYAESAKTEIPGIFNVFKEHPIHALGQGAAGLTELGHNILNLPHSLSEYGANRLNLIPKEFSEKIPYQKDISGEINQLFGNPEYPGEELIRGIARNALNLIGVGKIASSLNPLNLTSKNIAKDILKTQKQNKKLYNNLYNNLWEESKNKGFGDMSSVTPKIDMEILRKYSSKKSIAGVEDFIKNPTIQTAHNAKSDLLRLQRDLEKQTTLKTAERKQFKAASDAIENIKNNMFKNEKGIIDTDLLDKYNKIQQGYSTEVVPYSNKAINKFKRNEISPKELINSLSRGEFMQKKGKFHPEIGIRNKLVPALATVGAGGIAKMLYDNMMGNQSNTG